MNYKKITITFILVVTVSVCSFAQTISGGEFVTKLQHKANILNDCISFLAEKERSIDDKNYYMNQALNLFVNKGEPFKIDSIDYDGAYITIKSKFRNKPVKRKAKDYLQGVADSRYLPVDFTSIKFPVFPSVINTKDFVKVGDNLYRYSSLITRELAGIIDGSPVYKDITPYTYTVYLSVEDTITGKEYIIYLTDIEIDEIYEKK